jgi:arsenate reductase (thioredoxin)
MTDQPLSVLILCTGNSARSILGEAILAERGEGRIRSFSAGSKPKGVPHPGALRLLGSKGIDPSPFRSKSWNEFTAADGPRIDVAITVCDNAAQESCPVFMGAPIKAHWGLPDPADIEGDDAAVDAAFEATWLALQARVDALLALPFETMEPKALAESLARIGMMDAEA